MRNGLRSGCAHGATRQRGHRHGRVVDDAVADHLHDLWLERDRVGRDRRHLPCELLFLGQVLGRLVGTDLVDLHCVVSLADGHRSLLAHSALTVGGTCFIVQLASTEVTTRAGSPPLPAVSRLIVTMAVARYSRPAPLQTVPVADQQRLRYTKEAT